MSAVGKAKRQDFGESKNRTRDLPQTQFEMRSGRYTTKPFPLEIEDMPTLSVLSPLLRYVTFSFQP